MSKLKSPSLSRSERTALRSELLVKTGLSEAPPSYFFNMLPRYAAVTAYSFLLLIVCVSPIAFAAENSEPGDFLYPVKTIINEPIKKTVKAVIPYEPETEEDEDREKQKNDSEDDDPNNNSDHDKNVQTTPSTKKEIKQSLKDIRKDAKPNQTTTPPVPVVTDVIKDSADAISVPISIPIRNVQEFTEKKVKKKDEQEQEDEKNEEEQDDIDVPAEETDKIKTKDVIRSTNLSI